MPSRLNIKGRPTHLRNDNLFASTFRRVSHISWDQVAMSCCQDMRPVLESVFSVRIRTDEEEYRSRILHGTCHDHVYK